MLKDGINFMTKNLSAEFFISLLERFFVFPNEYWKWRIRNAQDWNDAHHLHVRFTNLDEKHIFTSSPKLVVKEVHTEVWNRDHDDDTDLVLVLTLE